MALDAWILVEGGLPAVGVGRKGNSVTCALQQRIGQIGPAAFEIGILLV